MPTRSPPCALTGLETAATCVTATSHERARIAGVLLDDLRSGRAAYRSRIQPVPLARPRDVGRPRRIHRHGNLALGSRASSQQTFTAGNETHPRRSLHAAYR